jgi:hypothetical protein
MRRYSQNEEQRVRAQILLREWASAKLLEPSQRARLESELRVDLKRTNGFLRAGLALFTLLIVAALFVLCTEGLDLSGRLESATTAIVLALLCIGLAEMLAGRFRFYRFGVEEALAVAAVFLLGFAAAALAAENTYDLFRTPSRLTGLTVCTAGGFWLYRRFGFVYAAIGSMACAAAIPFQLELQQTTMRAVAAAILTLVFLVVRSKRLQHGDDYPGDEYGQLQAAALAGIYIVLNLQLTPDVFDRGAGIRSGSFYWLTYAITWVLPILGLRLGIRGRDRMLLDISLVAALVTLLTNKPYLGSPRNEWDPMLLGVLLVAVAIGVRRWLTSGPSNQRSGFTPSRSAGKDSAVLTALRAASGAYRPDSLQPASGVSRDEPVSPPEFGGGRSGGAGGGGTY